MHGKTYILFLAKDKKGEKAKILFYTKLKVNWYFFF